MSYILATRDYLGSAIIFRICLCVCVLREMCVQICVQMCVCVVLLLATLHQKSHTYTKSGLLAIYLPYSRVIFRTEQPLWNIHFVEGTAAAQMSQRAFTLARKIQKRNN